MTVGVPLTSPNFQRPCAIEGHTLLLFRTAMAYWDSERVSLVSHRRRGALECSRNGFYARFVFRMLLKFLDLITRPITTGSAFSPSDSHNFSSA